MSENTRCGFVALIGAPNAGKSTITNHFVGSKVTIVSPKVQTTRTLVKGIGIKDNTQIIFVDTPGIFKPKRRLDKAMVSSAWDGVKDADITVLVVDAKRGFDDETKSIIARLKKKNRKAVLVINKVDLVHKDILLGFGLHCFGCPMSQMETIEEAAAVHGVEVDLMVEKINEFLNSK